ncbi:uroporphyrinogen decarboxylase [Marinitoga hydrogenitolerans DSM 16785]|uniref:Uroporphyrinogen decarboxylase n=1 Tax=Marinitoga hydrogenitolerans (strain DSM 16785 / JCM 12826 / AT1271) TaxID=1122195 RepID=A0A1M4YA41_MARH1|nr:uroporphyrinogen decarboxylase family protein [Marinitoga hydrogenitolerans]SHF02560.1 uroporphyrinogen decarboxylase [Marinitoga hydrogenitolerans DSM 16785]
MMKEMTSKERTYISISFKEPDRVPLFLCFSYYGAKELGMSVKEYFSNYENIVIAQMKMREKYNNDCYCTFFYASLEIESFGGRTIFIENGPPNAAEPIIKNFEHINSLEIPNVKYSKPLEQVFELQKKLKEKSSDDVPIIGVIISPFSLPIMQLGFDKYIELIYFYPDYFWNLINKNIKFSISWANMQLKAGADMIVYFDPMLSTEMLPKDIILKTGYKIAQKTLNLINGPAAIHLASAKTEGIVEELLKTKALALGISKNDNIKNLKNKTYGKMSLIGNLDGISMRKWNYSDVERNVKKIIFEGAEGGGLILSDNHGDIPWEVDENVLLSIAEVVKKYGKYPLKKD